MDASRYRKWTHFSVTDALPGSGWGTGGTGVGDFAGDGKLAVAVSRRETQTAYWFERTSDAVWVRHVIGQSEKLARTLGAAVLDIDRDDHGGIAPRGVGDLAGNGRCDIVLPGVWLENPGDGYAPWKRHRWPHEPIPNASYGTSIRSWVADINGSGLNDIVYSDCDTGFCHVYWVENKGGGREWVRHRLPDPPGNERTGSFHSLGVADIDGDGAIDIVNKVWNTDWNKEGRNYHVDFWRNDINRR